MSNVIKVINIHSDISRLYLLIKLDVNINNLIDTVLILQMEEKLIRSPDAVQLTNNLKDIIPDADPIYLDLVGEYYVYDNEKLSEFIGKITTDKKSYPRLQEYNERVNHLTTVKRLGDDFTVQEFLKICPDPVNYFKNIKLNSITNHYNESLSYLSDRCVLLVAIFNIFNINLGIFLIYLFLSGSIFFQWPSYVMHCLKIVSIYQKLSTL